MPDGARARIAAFAALVASGAGAASCETHDCDPSSSTLASGVVTKLEDGDLVWSSSPVEGPWVSFPGNVTITMNIPAGYAIPEGGPFPSVAVATGPNPGVGTGTTSTPGSGQLAEFINLTSTGFQIENASCAAYYVFVSVPIVPASADGGPSMPAAGDASGTSMPATDAGRD